MIRITQSGLYNNISQKLSATQVELAKTQEQLTSGKRVLKPSDDPTTATAVMNLKSKMALNERYGSNLDRADSLLRLQDSTLDSITDGLNRIKTLVVQAANSTNSSGDRIIIAEEISSLTEHLMITANTRNSDGSFIFSGYSQGQEPFQQDSNGAVNYRGSSDAQKIEIAEQTQMVLGIPGSDVFGTQLLPINNALTTVTLTAGSAIGANQTAAMTIDGTTFTTAALPANATIAQIGDAFSALSVTGWTISDDNNGVVTFTKNSAYSKSGETSQSVITTVDNPTITIGGSGTGSVTASAVDNVRSGDVFTGLANIISALRTNDTESIVNALDDIDIFHENITIQHAKVGARMNRVEMQQEWSDNFNIEYQLLLSELEDLDYIEAVSRLKTQTLALQAGQQSFAQISQLSLFDYIR
jgi:flagellar hook-associated protein 3 FlgL